MRLSPGGISLSRLARTCSILADPSLLSEALRAASLLRVSSKVRCMKVLGVSVGTAGRGRGGATFSLIELPESLLDTDEGGVSYGPAFSLVDVVVKTLELKDERLKASSQAASSSLLALRMSVLAPVDDLRGLVRGAGVTVLSFFERTALSARNEGLPVSSVGLPCMS